MTVGYSDSSKIDGAAASLGRDGVSVHQQGGQLAFEIADDHTLEERPPEFDHDTAMHMARLERLYQDYKGEYISCPIRYNHGTGLYELDQTTLILDIETKAQGMSVDLLSLIEIGREYAETANAILRADGAEGHPAA